VQGRQREDNVGEGQVGPEKSLLTNNYQRLAESILKGKEGE
jgi:hypothetical protein